VGEFVGAIAVVATLLYLAIQVRDAGRSSKFAAVQANRETRIGWFSSLRDSSHLPAIQAKVLSGEALETEDELRLTYHYAANWGLFYSEWVQRELGLMGEFATSNDMDMKFLLSSRSAMEVWRGVAQHLYPARFVEYVNKAAPTREAGAETSFVEDLIKAAPTREAGAETSFVEDLIKAATTREAGSAGASPPSSSDT
jgi:hypothetical protein